MGVSRSPLSAAAGLFMLIASACSDGGTPRKITQSRETEVVAGRDKLDATSAERFGTALPPAHPPTESATSDSNPAGRGGELVWTNPPGWIELPPTEMRYANLQPAGNPDAECSLSVLPGVVGGVTSNVNRWRKQFGLAEQDEAAIAALPSQPLLKLDARRVELEGEYAGMGGGPRKPGFALIGLIAGFADKMLFVKMTGPKRVVDAERAHFDDFVASLTIAENEVDPSAANPAVGAVAPPPESGDLEFTAPTGWTKDPARPMRLATLRPPGSTDTECSITVLANDGGGLMGNVDRWRKQQFGLPGISNEEFVALPKITLLGAEGVLVDLVGAFSDTMNHRSIPQARLLGAMAIVGARSVFVKLTGPEAEIDDQVRDGFRELCASLKE